MIRMTTNRLQAGIGSAGIRRGSTGAASRVRPRGRATVAKQRSGGQDAMPLNLGGQGEMDR
ncbi:hypothetical protein AWJ14_11115 [Hoeflea olei]|uniref:Uncharacterized protein n=1 Tax=Hoeflea olei TaxID=1480615 RepID=A0A1C1Z1E3_9HYPH|nr:hypothetical protein AWJ14_11115 [Hoeflea olei]